MFKTLIAELDGGELAVAVVPVPKQLDFKLLSASAGAKKAAMADQKAAGDLVRLGPPRQSPCKPDLLVNPPAAPG